MFFRSSLIAIVSFLLITAQSQSNRNTSVPEEEVNKLAMKYVGFTFLDSTLSSIVARLYNDPDIEIMRTRALNDSLALYIKARRLSFQPFTENFDTVKIILAESYTRRIDGLPDTFLVVQTHATAIGPGAGEKVTRAYKVLVNDIQKHLPHTEYYVASKKEKRRRDAHYYRDYPGADTYVGSAWQKDSEELAQIMITFRLPMASPRQ